MLLAAALAAIAGAIAALTVGQILAMIAALLAALLALYGLVWLTKNMPQIMAWIFEKIIGAALLGADRIRDIITRFFSENKDEDASLPPPQRPEWGSSGHADQLPKGGEVPYIPPKAGRGGPVRNPEGPGWVDKKGWIWTWDKSRHGGYHWDVRPPRHLKGKHKNVFPSGKVRS